MPSSDLFSLADEFFQACYAALGDTPAGPPSMAFVAPGPPPWDCELLTVHVMTVGLGDTLPLVPPLAPLHRAARQGEVNIVQLVATVIRCIPTMDNDGQFPAAADEVAAAAQQYADLWAIWNFCRRAKYLDLLFPPREREFGFIPSIVQRQQGGMAGWEIPIYVELDGYKSSLLPP